MGLFGTIFGGAINASIAHMNNQANLQAQREANRTNLQIAQMNNDYNERQFEKQLEYNYDMFDKQSDFSRETMAKQQAFETAQQDKQNQFNVDLWNMQNEYNSPAEQRARAEAAGYNPYMYTGGVAAGSVTSATASAGDASTPSALSASPPRAESVRVDPVISDLGGVTSAIQDTIGNIMQYKEMQSNVDLKQTQIDQNRIENKYRGQMLIAELAEKMANTDNVKLRSQYQSILNDFAADQQIADLETKRSNTALAKADTELKLTQNAFVSLQASMFPDQVKVQLAEGYAKIALMRAQQGLTNAQTAHEVKKMIKTIAETNGIKINNDILNRTKDSLVNIKLNEANKSYYNDGPDGWFGLPNIFYQAEKEAKGAWNKASDWFKSW